MAAKLLEPGSVDYYEEIIEILGGTCKGIRTRHDAAKRLLKLTREIKRKLSGLENRNLVIGEF